MSKDQPVLAIATSGEQACGVDWSRPGHAALIKKDHHSQAGLHRSFYEICLFDSYTLMIDALLSKHDRKMPFLVCKRKSLPNKLESGNFGLLEQGKSFFAESQ